MNEASHRRGFLMFEFIVGILQTVSKQYHFRFDCAEKPVFTRLSEPLQSFPLNGSRGFGGDVINYAVDAGDLVYYAV